MKFHVLTLFPELIESTFSTSITGRAMEKDLISLHAVNIRDYANNKHQKVDDYPYGGGAGMVMQAEPVYQAFESLKKDLKGKPRVIYVTPQGRVFDQELARELSLEEEVVFLCGHYEGIDERVLEEIVTDYVSIGDYVLTGGELPALVMMDAVSRLVPGVLNNDVSAEFESFYGSLLEYPQYSRPEEWHGKKVPSELMTGNHKKIRTWRMEQSVARTKDRRPDLYREYERRCACEKQLMRNKLVHMDMLESLRWDRAKIQLYEDRGIVLWNKMAGILQSTFECPVDEAAYLQELASDLERSRHCVKHVVLHKEENSDKVRKWFGLSGCSKYEQWVYTLKNPLPLCYDAEVRMLEEGHTYCAYIEGQPVACIDTSPMGVIEGVRELVSQVSVGVKKAVITAWANQLISQGQVPILWAKEEDASLQNLPEELGFYCAKNPVWSIK